jgi:hypothetical protein
MAGRPAKIEFGENHRRVISVLMRGTERACDAVVEWLDRRPTILADVRDDLTPEAQKRLRTLAGQLKGEVLAFSREAALDKKESSIRRSIAAIVSATLIDLQEIQNSGLRGYGPLGDREKKALDDRVRRMITLLHEMLRIAEAE